MNVNENRQWKTPADSLYGIRRFPSKRVVRSLSFVCKKCVTDVDSRQFDGVARGQIWVGVGDGGRAIPNPRRICDDIAIDADAFSLHSPLREPIMKSSLIRSASLCLTLLAVSSISFAEDKKQPPHDAIKPVPRGGGWMNRHKSMNERVAKGNVGLVFIGDSITQGWEGRGKKVWAKYYGKRNAVNLGIGGDRTQHVIWRLDNGNLKGISPKAAVIMIGTNNSGGNSPEQIAEGVTRIVRQLQEKTPKTKILLLATFPRGATPADKRRQVNEKSNAIVAKLAKDDNVEYLDIGAKFLGDDGSLSREIMPDLLHLSEGGYTIWATSIEEKLAALLGE